MIRRFRPPQTLIHPFVFALGLSGLTFLLALLVVRPAHQSMAMHGLTLLGYWQQGFWGLLSFSMQMVVMLVMGQLLANTPLCRKLIEYIGRFCTTTPIAAAVVSLSAMIMGLFNWSLGLIFGALLAHHVVFVTRASTAHASPVGKDGGSSKGPAQPMGYALIASAGYSAMVIWHAGLSGSAPLLVSEPGHFLAATMGVVPVSQTLFSPMNLAIVATCLIAVPLSMAGVGMAQQRWWPDSQVPNPSQPPPIKALEKPTLPEEALPPHQGWYRFEQVLLKSSGLIIMGLWLWTVVQAYHLPDPTTSTPITLNSINFLLYGLVLWSYGRLTPLLEGARQAMAHTVDIVLQFPLYAGLMGIFTSSGLLVWFSAGIVGLIEQLPASANTLMPIGTLLSAGVVNMFVPSGGGQWAVQGPLLAELALKLHVPMGKMVMAFAYGDQLTNMVQPFWALPLLAITGLRPTQLLPYTTVIMIVSALVFTLGLLLF